MRARTVYIAMYIQMAALPGCSFDWTDVQPPLVLVGEPPAPGSLQPLNTLPAGHSSPFEGPDGAPWAAFCEYRPEAERRACTRMHLARLDGTPGDDVVEARAATMSAMPTILLRYRALYVLDGETLAIHRPGDPEDVTFSSISPSGFLHIVDGGADDVFVYIAPGAASFDTYRRDMRYHRSVPLPAGVDLMHPDRSMEFLFTPDGTTLVARGPDGQTTAWSTLDEGKVPLGTRPTSLFMDAQNRALLTVGDDGFRSVPLAGGADRVLAPATDIDPTTVLFDDAGLSWFANGEGLWRVPLDGSAPPSLVAPGAARLRALGPRGEEVYSHDPASRYSNGAGDGVLGGWSFMERGVRVRFNAADTHVHFLEHAARLGVVGDLMSAALPASPGGTGGSPVLLGLNVHQIEELPDGRILAVENHAFPGSWNRLVAIDETRLEARWVMAGADQFFMVPGAGAVVVDVVSGVSGWNVVRVPLP
jgi:hypothetical protein